MGAGGGRLEAERRIRSRRFSIRRRAGSSLCRRKRGKSGSWVKLKQPGSRLPESHRVPVWSSRQKGFRKQPGADCERDPVVECLSFADAETEFLLKVRLEAMPEFDPEGWALRLIV